MAKGWEYLSIDIDFDSGLGLHNKLNTLGADGWELAHAQDYRAFDASLKIEDHEQKPLAIPVHCIFKRQKGDWEKSVDDYFDEMVGHVGGGGFARWVAAGQKEWDASHPPVAEQMVTPATEEAPV